MEAELQGLQAGEERRGSNASQTCDGCLEAFVETILSPWEQMELRPLYKGSKGEWEQHKGRCQEENQSAVGVTNVRRINEGAPASSLELDLCRVRDVPSEGGGAGKSGAQGDRKRGPSRSPGRPSMDEEEDDDFGDLVPRKKPGKGPQETLKKSVREGTPVF